MPKEQPCLSEHSPRATSSKNAKDKSNSTTLLAIRDTKDTDNSSGRGSRCNSEKDSGFSDGSDWQQTDAEDQRKNKVQSRASEHTGTLPPGQNQEPGWRNPGNPTLTLAGPVYPPIYVVKDMVHKQPGMIQKRNQLLWRNDIKKSNSSGSPHVIFFQQPNLQLPKPLSKKSYTAGKKIHGTYLPILNSYPRIAPHPSKKPPDKSSSTHESQNLSKRVCTEHKANDTAVTRGSPEQHLHKQPKLAVSTSDLLHSSSPRNSRSYSSSTTSSTAQGSPSVSTSHTTSNVLTARGHRNTTSIRNRRFLNTVQILRQSGLLDITLRTKELLRQSNATERDIAELRQHTELLCQTVSNPIHNLNGLTAWEQLYRVMADSGSYPDLRILQNIPILTQPDSDSKPDSISVGDTNSPQAAETSDVPPSCLLTTESDQSSAVLQETHPERGRKREIGGKSSDTVTFMSPDSSTG
ncbi:CLOCK-interacting pacemaker isoform X2 [Parambassis ranga]|uniref:CLOCK-interacting pacemaker isoform X2 n=1 Tax=Parambassis ranga TaxID=210632 RepID=A0A6P7JHW6_9TELE|nr:CLOCK-interacting pacemaker-like isoform X2 [Parambassis ranga]